VNCPWSADCRSAVICTTDGGPSGGRRQYGPDAVHVVGESSADADVVEGRSGACADTAAFLHRRRPAAGDCADGAGRHGQLHVRHDERARL